MTARGTSDPQDVVLQIIENGGVTTGWHAAYGFNPTEDWAPILYTTLAATIHVVALRYNRQIYGKRAY